MPNDHRSLITDHLSPITYHSARMPSAISIIICTFNRLPYLKQCIEALKRLNTTGIQTEIIIVNDASTDGTESYLNTMPPEQFRVINLSKNVGLSLAKNIGIEHSTHEIVAFTDDDCTPHPNWVQKLLAGFTDETIGAVIGQTFYVSETHKGYFPERMVQNIGARWPMGGNIAYRKNIIQKLGGFSDRFYRYNNEDSEFALRAVKAEIKYARAEDAIIYHQPMDWTVKSLLASAKNASVWPVLKRMYPDHFDAIRPPIWRGIIIHPRDYIFILFLPFVFIILLIRYIINGKRDFKLFFAKWPGYLFLRRYYIYKEAIRNRVFML